MASKHILVVDDEIGIRELLRDILQDEGYSVQLAENAAAARAAAAVGRRSPARRRALATTRGRYRG